MGYAIPDSDHITGFPGHAHHGIIDIMRASKLAAILALALTSSCGGYSTSNGSALTVAVTPAQATLTGTRTGSGASALVTCSAPVTITANGGVGLDFARWVQANVTYTAGSSSNSQVLSSSQVGAWFNNADRVNQNSTLTGTIVLSQPTAFSATVVINYITQTTVGSAPTITVTCQ